VSSLQFEKQKKNDKSKTQPLQGTRQPFQGMAEYHLFLTLKLPIAGCLPGF
jgi:hypothetical protein